MGISRKRGAIVNTSSIAGRKTSPMLAEYSGAKSFNEMFSRGLKAELAPFNIHVQCQAPLFVATKMAKIRMASLTVPSIRANISAAQVWTVISWCTYPVVYLFPMMNIGGSTAVVAVQLGYTVSDIISKCGVGILIYQI